LLAAQPAIGALLRGLQMPEAQTQVAGEEGDMVLPMAGTGARTSGEIAATGRIDLRSESETLILRLCTWILDVKKKKNIKNKWASADCILIKCVQDFRNIQ
jgi:hypothetical protein